MSNLNLIENNQNDCNYENKNIIIGAGLSGIMLAIKMEKLKMPYIILEKSNNVGGVWNMENGLMNSYTRIQTRKPSFKLELSDKDFDDYATSDQVQDKILDKVKEYNMKDKIKFNHEVLYFKWNDETSKVDIEIKNTNFEQQQSNNKHEILNISAKSLHIRTGTINKSRQITIKNEDKFKGKIYYGSNSKFNIYYQNKKVVIMGMGASTMENAQHAIKNGAQSVTIITRNLRPVWSKFTMFKIVQKVLNPLNVFSNYSRVRSWLRINETHRKIMESQYDSEYSGDTMKTIFNKTIVNYTDNPNEFDYKIKGPPQSAASDAYFIASYYGLIKTVEDEIINCEENCVKTKNGLTIDTDLIIKCVGFEMDTKIFKGHDITDVIFIDGQANISHNCAVDRLRQGEYFLTGPHSTINFFPLISYTLINEIYDTLILEFGKRKGMFRKFLHYRNFHTGPLTTTMEAVHINTYFYILWKMICFCLHYLFSNIFANLKIANFFIEAIYQITPEKEFLEINKREWDEFSKFCQSKVNSRNDGKTSQYYEYPY